MSEGEGMKKPQATGRRRAGDRAGPAIDFDELPSYVGYQVRRTQAKIFAEFEAALALAQLTPGSFGVDKSTMSPVISRLEKRRLIRREVLPSDRRRQALYLETGAEPQYQAVREKVRAFEAGVAARLTRSEQRELARLLAKLQGGSAGPR